MHYSHIVEWDLMDFVVISYFYFILFRVNTDTNASMRVYIYRNKKSIYFLSWNKIVIFSVKISILYADFGYKKGLT